MNTIEESNAALRSAVEARLDAKLHDPEENYTPRGPSAVEVMDRFSPSHPTSQAFYDLCDQVKAMHRSKSNDYGSASDPLANIRNGAEFVGIEPWQGAMVRLSDKVTRLATFNRTGTLHYEGVEDTLMDLASYSLLALLLYRESK